MKLPPSLPYHSFFHHKLMYVMLVIFILFVLSMTAKHVFANLSSTINATIKISICGNGVHEGGEDCDQSDLGGKSCETVGFGPGTLSCDIGCGYDTTACTPPTPTPTPTPTPSTSTSAENSVQPTPTPSPSPAVVIPSIPFQFELPETVLYFIKGGTDKLIVADLHTIIQTWVNEWRSFAVEQTTLQQNISPQGKTIPKCDINKDGYCNLQDFSVLMYYIGRSS